jgi:hypothetical protein
MLGFQDPLGASSIFFGFHDSLLRYSLPFQPPPASN